MRLMSEVQAVPDRSAGQSISRVFWKTVRFFFLLLLIPAIAMLVVGYFALQEVEDFEALHDGKIITGVHAWGVDLSQLTADEAQAKLEEVVPVLNAQIFTVTDEQTGKQWTSSAETFNVQYDLDETVAQAFRVGRSGETRQDVLLEQFLIWYGGQEIQPTIIFNEAPVDALITQIAEEIEVGSIEADLSVTGTEVVFQPAQTGRRLDKDNLRAQLVPALVSGQSADVAIQTSQVEPQVVAVGDTAEKIQRIIGAPINFYIENPATGADLQNSVLTTDKLVEWLHVERVPANGDTENSGWSYNVFIDEIAARNWVAEFEAQFWQASENARFYFDDTTKELVLVEPHTNGRYLDIDATTEKLLAAIESTDRTIPFVINEITPTVHSNVTGAELGITELISPTATTYFDGSSPERMTNIARSASNFYGIVIAPGEQFSFNKYLGEISEEQGYSRGLIIAGGRTIEGIGGGVCQVSTTMFQAAFWAGFSIDERWQHAYRVGYYEGALGPDEQSNIGMDATIYSPVVDLKFTNNTPHHLLIENYYNERHQSLTVKFYSTSMGRRVERNISIWGETPAKADIYEYRADYEGDDLNQVDWANEGAFVSIERVVYNSEGNVRERGTFNSSYIPWANIYEYGPDFAGTIPDPNAPSDPPPAEEAETSGN